MRAAVVLGGAGACLACGVISLLLMIREGTPSPLPLAFLAGVFFFTRIVDRWFVR